MREKEYKTAASLMLLTGRILQALSLLAGGLLAFWVLGPDQVERILANIDDFLMNKVYGIRIWRVLVIALIVGIGVGFKKFFASNVMHILKNISSRTETTIDDYIIDAADKPAQLLSISASIHIASFFIPWSNWINTVVNGAVVADAVTINTIRDTINTGFMIIYICIAAYFVFRLVDKAATYGIELSEKKAKDKVPERTRFDATLIVTFRKFLKVIVVIFAAMMVLDRLGVDIRMVIASFTVASAAVAFAARDSIANVFGAFVLSIDRPFSLGDWIVAGGTEGTVEEIGLRSTQIRTFAKSLVSIPNNQLMNMTIDNMSKRPRQRVKATIGVKYSSDPEKVEQLVDGIKKLILENKNTWHDYYQIWFTEFGPSSLNILLYFFIESTVWEDFLRERQNIYLDIMRLVKGLELEFAFPSQTIYFDDPKALQRPAMR
ncbi:MAG: mechanosensitive ion channel family protein [Planctomycetota bacterium]|nr:mechanosensitive ion channel family protein [Planctomycetota bacterium]